MHKWISQEIIELLESVWTNEEKGANDEESIASSAKTTVTEDLLAECEREGYITRNLSEIELTPLGRKTAEDVIRRHRIAERLVVDVLGMTLEEVESDACEFEHLVAPGIIEAICTLLGHPRTCPHNLPIPEGHCCRKHEHHLDSVVTSVDNLNVGDRARVAYVSARNYSRVQKLSSLGISPGVTIRLHQKFPGFVIQCDETQIAVEKDIAKDIFVWQDDKVTG